MAKKSANTKLPREFRVGVYLDPQPEDGQFYALAHAIEAAKSRSTDPTSYGLPIAVWEQSKAVLVFINGRPFQEVV